MNETRHGGTVEIGAATPMLTAERWGWVILSAWAAS
jgi:hypothetical protein